MVNSIKIPLPSLDPRLRRNINHDAASGQYPLDVSGLSIVDCAHSMHISTLNQGDVGKCTAESACENMASDPFWSTFIASVQSALNDRWTDAFYSDEGVLQGTGPFPPNDQGSDGLTSAKVLLGRQLISGYEHTFTAEDAIKGLQLRPASWGTMWKTGMDNVNTTTGQVKYSGTTRGGHQMCLYRVVAKQEQVWFRQSWGSWGYQGSGVGWISFDDFAASLADQGDVTFFRPLSLPAPVPTPPAPAQPVTDPIDAALLGVGAPWASAKRTGANQVMKLAFLNWRKAKGY